jgi:hypothetical protein
LVSKISRIVSEVKEVEVAALGSYQTKVVENVRHVGKRLRFSQLTVFKDGVNAPRNTFSKIIIQAELPVAIERT